MLPNARKLLLGSNYAVEDCGKKKLMQKEVEQSTG